jgi:phosphoserine phosphatase
MHSLNEDLTGQSELYFLQAGNGQSHHPTRGPEELLFKVKDLLNLFEHQQEGLQEPRVVNPSNRPSYVKLTKGALEGLTRNATTELRAQCQTHGIDLVLMPSPRSLGSYKLLAMDMDSTVISIECLDEVADFCGKKAEVASITEAAMRGEITDYAESLRRRVAFLKDLSTSALQSVLSERLRINPGAKELVAAAKSAGLHCLLISGGFHPFTGYVAEILGFDEIHCNTLGMENGKLTGEVIGPIVDHNAKKEAVIQTAAKLGIDAGAKAIAIGDGANDLPMMTQVHLSLAYRAKPVVANQAAAQFNFADLNSLLDCLNEAG